MNSIYDTRRENLRLIITERFAGSQAQFARALGLVDPAMISRILSGKPSASQNMGSGFARRIEQRFGLEPNAMDQQPSPSATQTTAS